MRGRAMPHSRRTSPCSISRVRSSRDAVIASLTGAQRQVRGGQRHPQMVRRQQHDRMARAGALGQVFGVTGEWHAGVVDGALLHRRGDHGRELTLHAARDGAVQQGEHVARVGGVQLASVAMRRERHVDDFEVARLGGVRAARRIRHQFHLEPQQPRAFSQQGAIANDREPVG